MRVKGAILALAIGLIILFFPIKWSFALLSMGFITLVAFLRPFAVFPLLALSIPFGSIREIGVGPARVGLTELAVMLLVGAWLARKLILKEEWGSFGSFFAPFLVLYGAMLASVLQASSLEYSLKELLKWGEVFLIYLILCTSLKQKEIPWVIGGLLLAGLLEGAFGVYQFFARAGPEHFVVMGRFMRAYGHFMQPNPFGGYMGLVMPLALALGLCLLLDGKIPWRLRFGLALSCLIVAILTGTALVMSWSRGAWLGALAAVVCVAMFTDRRFALALGALALTLVVLLKPMPQPFLARFQELTLWPGLGDLRTVEITDENYAVVERLAHWDAAIRMWGDHLWFGVGIGNYEPAYPAYALPRWPEPLGHAHNYYLNIAAETGLLGLGAYLLFWGWVFFKALKAIGSQTGWKRGILIGAVGSFIHLTVHNFFDNLYVHGMYLHVAALLGLVSMLQDLRS